MSKVPFWYKFTWFLGRAPALTRHQWKLLGLMAAVSFFEQYDVYLFALNLKQIQAELQIPEEDLGLLGAIVRAGAILAIGLAIAADRVGRRIMLLTTILGYTLFTGATAFSPNTETFIVFQFLARGFATAEVWIAAVVIAEEFAPEHRGWGIGALGALQATGAGFAALMFGFVDYLPYGWRFLYLVGLVPLLLIAYWRRELPETHRYQQIKHIREPIMKPIAELFTKAPRRTIGLFLTVFGFVLAAGSATFFAPKYLQDVHHWTPGEVATLNILGGMLAIIGNPLAGWLSDRFGRKPVTIIFAVIFSLCSMVFFASSGVFVPLLWIGLIFFVMGGDVMTTSYGTELFPTRYRSTASGFRGLVSAFASVVGLAAVSGLFVYTGSNWVSLSILAAVSLIAPVVVWLMLPETARKPLEEIAPN
ncbi:MAG: MFS transporter [Pseudomonadales bacterium]